MNPLPTIATRATGAAPENGGTMASPDAGAAGKALSASAHEFESMAIGEFLQPMFSTIDDTSNLFGGGEAEGILKPMLVTEFAKLMEQKGGLGLEPLIEQKMGELSEAKDRRR